MLAECSYSGHQSPYYCLRESFYCSHLFTCSTNNPSTPQEELGLNQVFLLGFCIPFLRLLIIHVKKWCFFTAFSLSPLQVPVTSLCRLPSSCLLFFFFPFYCFSYRTVLSGCFFVTNASLHFASETSFSVSLQIHVIYHLVL